MERKNKINISNICPILGFHKIVEIKNNGNIIYKCPIIPNQKCKNCPILKLKK